MNGSQLTSAACACSSPVPASRPRRPKSGPKPAPKPEPRPDWAVSLLRCLYIRDDCYWPDPYGEFETLEDLRPILISTDLLLTGGFVAGMKVDGAVVDLELVYFDEFGRAFECLGIAGRRRLANFLPRGFVRIRLFSDLCWKPIDAPPLSNENFHGHAMVAVTDDRGERHHFAFPVTNEFRDLFPPFLAEVT